MSDNLIIKRLDQLERDLQEEASDDSADYQKESQRTLADFGSTSLHLIQFVAIMRSLTRYKDDICQCRSCSFPAPAIGATHNGQLQLWRRRGER